MKYSSTVSAAALVALAACQDKIPEPESRQRSEPTLAAEAPAKKEPVPAAPAAKDLVKEDLAEGTGPAAKSGDSVSVHYTGTLLDGTKFDSSYDRGQPISFPLNGVIAGWTEGVQLMATGATYEFYIPHDLAYGPRGAGGVIPPFATLIFKVELLGIE
jgi:FKBP-type peptidyl-prolyl cis-trans isomerase